jgi:hypothetical protein
MQRFGGLRISASKSSVAPIRCSQVNLDEVLPSFSGARASFPISYLGLPITLGRLRLVHLQSVFDRAAAKMAGWQGQLLNIGGRRELIRTVLDSLPTYLLTALRPPKKFYQGMDKLRKRFLWAGHQRLHGGKCKVSRPLSHGGLGMVDLERFGRALRLRWLWFQWKCPDKAWNRSELPIDSVDESLFAAATRVHIHNGKKAKFWTSSWLNGASPAALFPTLFDHSRKKNRSVAEALHNENWIRDLMHNVSATILTDYVMLWSMIDVMHLDLSDPADDDIVLTRTTDGVYSANSAYRMQFVGSLLPPFPATIWGAWAPSRCKLSIWLMVQNRVWTADRLLAREWPNQYFCPLCYRNLETIDHLLIKCPLSRQAWSQVSSWTSQPQLHPQSRSPNWGVPEWYNRFACASRSSTAKGVCSIVILVCCSIWKERNARIFDGHEKSISQLVTECRDEARLWVRAGAKALSLLAHAPSPVLLCYKLCFLLILIYAGSSPELSKKKDGVDHACSCMPHLKDGTNDQ